MPSSRISPRPNAPGQREQVKTLIEKYGVELIAIGNGTASRETDQFVGEILASMETKTGQGHRK